MPLDRLLHEIIPYRMYAVSALIRAGVAWKTISMRRKAASAA
jgi:hypothetical protein